MSGFTTTDSDNQRTTTNQLMYVHLLVVGQETCSSSVSKLKQARNDLPSLTNNMFCAGLPDGGKDSCHGDSGSLLMRNYSKCSQSDDKEFMWIEMDIFLVLL